MNRNIPIPATTSSIRSYLRSIKRRLRVPYRRSTRSSRMARRNDHVSKNFHIPTTRRSVPVRTGDQGRLVVAPRDQRPQPQPRSDAPDAHDRAGIQAEAARNTRRRPESGGRSGSRVQPRPGGSTKGECSYRPAGRRALRSFTHAVPDGSEAANGAHGAAVAGSRKTLPAEEQATRRELTPIVIS